MQSAEWMKTNVHGSNVVFERPISANTTLDSGVPRVWVTSQRRLLVRSNIQIVFYMDVKRCNVLNANVT